MYALFGRFSREWIRKVLEHPLFLPLCFSVFLLVRIALVAFVPVAPSSDASWYFARGKELAETGAYYESGVPTAYWPVGYPAFLGAIFYITGSSVLAAQIANIILSVFIFWLFYKLVYVSFNNSNIARMSLLLVTIYPNNAAYVPAVLTETMYTFLLLFACVLLITGKSTFKFILIAITFGLAILVKTQTIMITPILVGLAYMHDWTFRELLRGTAQGAAVLLLSLMVVLPWTWRNYTVFGEFVLVSTNGGAALLNGNNDSVVSDYFHDTNETDPLYKQAGYNGPFDQAAADKRARQLGKQWILNNPAKFISLIPKKLFRLWAPDGEGEWFYQAGTPWYGEHAVWFRIVRILNQIYYFFLLGICALGVRRLFREGITSVHCMYIAEIMFVTLQCVVFSGQSRYHFPAMPFVIAIASYEIIRRISTSDSRKLFCDR